MTNKGLKHDVKFSSITTSVINTTTEVFTTGTVTYAGTKIASSVTNPAGKARIIVETVITLWIINLMFDNKKSPSKIDTSVNSNNEEEPPSSSGSASEPWVPNVSEPGDMGSSIYYTIKTTDQYMKFLEDMLTLSELTLVFMFTIGVNLILILIDFEKFKLLI